MMINELLNELVDACSLAKDDAHTHKILPHVFLSLKALKLEATMIQFNHACVGLVNETDFQINPNPIPFRKKPVLVDLKCSAILL
jgi:hypothetical protein